MASIFDFVVPQQLKDGTKIASDTGVCDETHSWRPATDISAPLMSSLRLITSISGYNGGQRRTYIVCSVKEDHI